VWVGWPRPVGIRSFSSVTHPTHTPIHATSRDNYMSCQMADWERRSIGLCCIAWRSGLGQAECWRMLRRKAGRTRWTVGCNTYLFLFSLLPFPLTCQTVVSVTAGGRLYCRSSLCSSFKWGDRDGRVQPLLSLGERFRGWVGAGREGGGCELEPTLMPVGKC
jgi:hypothetical protein